MSRYNVKKYSTIFIAALVLEVGSTMYIRAVADNMVYQVMFWALVGPLMNLPFFGFFVDAKTWRDRLKVASSQGIGFAAGAGIVMLYLNI